MSMSSILYDDSQFGVVFELYVTCIRTFSTNLRTTLKLATGTKFDYSIVQENCKLSFFAASRQLSTLTIHQNSSTVFCLVLMQYDLPFSPSSLLL
jgi:hypothetical protein